MKYTINDFHLEYPSEDVCLDKIFQKRFFTMKECPKCKKDTKFHRVTKRRCYACKNCGFQLHPTAGTVFHHSPTPLKMWFYAMFLFSTSKNGVSAKELQRHLGVTYKCAYRIGQQIRKLMDGSPFYPSYFTGKEARVVRASNVPLSAMGKSILV